MLGYEVYCYYVAIKLHFNNDSYDFISANGHVKNITKAAYSKRTDKYFFEKIGKRYCKKDIIPFFVSNFIINSNMWSGDLATFETSTRIYREWVGKIHSLSSVIVADLQNIKAFLDENSLEFANILSVDKGTHTHPVLIRFYLQGMINIETLLFLDYRFSFIEKYNKVLIDPLWESISKLLAKYSRFLLAVNWENILTKKVDK